MNFDERFACFWTCKMGLVLAAAVFEGLMFGPL